MNANINIARRFDSVLSAIQILESEGKLDLSYNRPLALQDAKFLDRTPRTSVVLVFADAAGQLWYVINHEGENILHRYEPFSSILSDGPLNVYSFRPDESTILNIGVVIPNTGKARRAFRGQHLCVCSH